MYTHMMLIGLPQGAFIWTFLCKSTETFLNDALIPGQISRIPVAVYGYKILSSYKRKD